MPRVPERRRAGRDVTRSVRASHLHSALRGFCLGSFAFFGREIEEGAEIQFVFEEHGSRDRPTLYEYRPLVRDFVEARGGRLLGHDDTVIALEALGREPAAAIFARAHAGALRRARPLPHRPAAAARGRGRVVRRVRLGRRGLRPSLCERSSSRSSERSGAYAAVAPLMGVEAGGIVELGDGLRVRHAADGELAAHWPDAARLVPESFGRETDRMCVLELERTLPVAGGEPPDAPGEIADAVTALRLATSWPDRGRAGALRAARLAALRRPARATDRRDAASGRADSARSLSRRDRAYAAGAGSPARSTTASWATRSTAGSSRSSRPTRSVRSSLRSRWRRCSVPATGLGGFAPGCGAAGRERPRAERALSTCCGRLGDGEAETEAGELVRRALVETLTRGDRPGSSPSWTSRCSACGRSRRAACRRRSLADGIEHSRSRSPAQT